MTGENLPPQEVREESRRDFLEIHDYALQVKIQLQQAYGYFGDGSIHFANAYFPVVFSERVEVWKGDIFAGSAGFDPANALLKINQGGDYGSMEYFDPVVYQISGYTSDLLTVNILSAPPRNK